MREKWFARRTVALIFAVVWVCSNGLAHAAVTITSTGPSFAGTTSPDPYPAFYIDTGVTGQNSLYVSYRITSTTAENDVWVTIGSFTGGVVSLGTNEDGILHLGSFTAGQTKTAFFYLTASGITATTQSHTVQVLNGPPGTGTSILPGGTAQTFSFRAVETTLAASANKVDSVVVSPSDPAVGGTFTITVTGETGVIGAGTSGGGAIPSGKVISLSPAVFSSWPANAFELRDSTVTLTGGNTGTFVDRLYIAPPNSPNTDYVVTYTFSVTGTTSGTTTIVPISYISSGTQIKYTGGLPNPLPTINPTAPNLTTLSVSPTPATLPSTGGTVTYTVTIVNSSASAITLDDHKDTLPAGTTYSPGTSTFNGASISNPTISGTILTWAGTFSVPASGSSTLSYQVTYAGVPGTYMNSVIGHAGNVLIDTTAATTDNVPATSTVTVNSPPTVAIGFTPTAIAPNAAGVLTITLTNPNTTAITGAAFTNTYPTNLVNTDSASAATTCGGTVTGANNGLSVALSGGTIPLGGSCTVTVNVTSATAGAYVNTIAIGGVTTTNAGSNAVGASATLTVNNAPIITNSFAVPDVAVNGTTTMNITIENPAANTVVLTTVAFTDTYPTGLTGALTATTTGTDCTGTLTAVSGSLALTNGTVPINTTCTYAVVVTGATAGAKPNSTGAVTSANGPNGTAASATLNVNGGPTVTQSFGASPIAPNAASILTITLTNPNATAITSAAFTDTYPTNLVNTGSASAATTCGGTVTGANGGSSVALSGGTIPASGSCTVTVNVTATTAGSYVNTISVGGVTTTNAGSNATAASATLNVNGGPTVTETFTPSSTGVNVSSLLTITLTNPNTNAITGAAFTGTYPVNLVNTATASAATTCGGTVTGANGGSSVALSGGTIPASGSCTVTVNTTSAVAGTYINTIGIGDVTTTNAGSNAAAASATLTVALPPTPAVVKFYAFSEPDSLSPKPTPVLSSKAYRKSRFAVSGTTAVSEMIQADGAQCDNGSGVFSDLPLPKTLGRNGNTGTSIPLSVAVSLLPTKVYHVGEAVFVTLADGNQNIDPLVREWVIVDLSVALTGDQERLRLQETGPNTGVFAGAIQSAATPPNAVQHDCKLSINVDVTIKADYTDPFYPEDVTTAESLVDPFGIVFNATTGEAINGTKVTLINVGTGLPATVFGDDGVSSYPSTVITGSTFTAGGITYVLQAGQFRFPFIPVGDYRLDVTPPTGFTTPSTRSPAEFAANPLTSGYVITTGSYGDVFTVQAGPAIRIDTPSDPPATLLVLQKSVSRPEATVGDFVSYKLNMRNLNPTSPATTVTLTDTLPIGFRYQGGSARKDGTLIPDPTISTDGRTLLFPIGAIVVSGTVQVEYVVSITSGAVPGDAVNRAIARADGGVQSNNAMVTLRVRPPFLGPYGTIIGRVVDGACQTAWEKLTGVAPLAGVPNVRVMMEDGTYVITDQDGQFHFEQVSAGTHVVQLDLNTLPDNRDAIHCLQNTRFAGRAFSQFVEMQGGMLWRTDFYTGEKGKPVPLVSESAPKPPPMVAGPKPKHGPEPSLGIRVQGKRIESAKPSDQVFNLDMHFDFGKARLTTEGISKMDSLIRQLQGFEVNKVEIIGHTDSVRIARSDRKTFSGNQALSMARARVVAAYLREGIGLLNNQVLVSGHGQDKPIGNNKTPDGRLMNRRVDVRLFAARPIEPSRLAYRIDIEGGAVPVHDVIVKAHLPSDSRLVPGTVRVDGVSALDPVVDNDVSTFRIGGVDVDGRHVVEFEAMSSVLSSKGYVLRVNFESGSAIISPSVAAEIDQFAIKLADMKFDFLEVIGHTDNNPILFPDRAGFKDNTVLSDARARAVTDYFTGKLKLARQSIRTNGRGPDEPIGDNKTPEGRALNRRVVTVVHKETSQVICPKEEGLRLDAYALFSADQAIDLKTPEAEAVIPCEIISSSSKASEGMKEMGLAYLSHGNQANGKEASANPPLLRGILTTQLGGSQSNLGTGVPTMGGFYPMRGVALGQAIGKRSLRQVAAPIDSLGIKAVSIDSAGTETSLPVFNRPVQMEFLPDRSLLIADGITKPTIAVRFTDREGNSVGQGVKGPYTIHPPYLSWQQVELTQKRQLAGLDRFDPIWKTEGNDGIAFITLAPTTQTGEVVIELDFEDESGPQRKAVSTWLVPAVRDFVLVGFAEGTIGYDTLKGNMEAITATGTEDNLYTDGKVSLYAKGKIKGEWVMTLAFDSDKPDQLRRKESLFGVVDPGTFYTLYGDATGQGHDASSQSNLYIKIERKQFYALFGDFETGLTQTRLARYSRALNGLKASYVGDKILFTAFAAETPQAFTREEIQGNGTSGLYRLSHGSLVLNSERVRIETRDRFKSEQMIGSRLLTRHLDYDIDYIAGTLFFREPIQSRDENFNPIFIVTEYETLGVAGQELNAGGHVGVRLLDGKLTLGVSQIRDEGNGLKTDLSGADMKLKLGENTELRVEGAFSRRQTSDGSAYLAEMERRGEDWSYLAYTNRQGKDFGVGQQSPAQQERTKTGLSVRLKITDPVALFAEGSREENMATQQTRDLSLARVEYGGKNGSVFGGVQVARDETISGQSFESQQAIAGASRKLFGDTVEISGRADFALGGKDGSLDYPSRYLLSLRYKLTKETRLILSHEISDGASFDNQMTRVGMETSLWKGARLTSTINQNINEYGPRTFAVYGLSQSLLFGEHWGVDLTLDQSRSFNEATVQAPVLNLAQPIASGGSLGGGVLNDDYLSVSAGTTYRNDLWSWNARVESRHAGSEDRIGLVTGFLHEARAGVAFATSLRYFETDRASGAQGRLGNMNLSWAYRPLGYHWAVLDKLEFRHETLSGGSGIVGSGLFGAASLSTTQEAKSRAMLNHFNLNRVSRAWDEHGRQGNLFHLSQRNQWSFYYGARYSFDQYGGTDYKGYTGLLGLDVRHDLTTQVDIGIHANNLHSLSDGNSKYSYGPSIGFSPIENGWLTLGYNFAGFRDNDFEQARYTIQGVYFTVRIKFDQESIKK